MLTLNDGRAELWQWDTGSALSVDADCSQVHFSNKVFGRSIDVDVVDGVAIIPDILLQTDKDLSVWAFVGTAENGYTKISKTFKVNRRNKPADYVFTPVDQKTLDDLQSQIGDLADLTTEEKGTLVAAINEAARTGGGGGGSTVELDTTMTQSGKAADAKAVGDALAGKQNTISDLEAIRTGAAKGATALQSVPSTYRTASEQDTIDDGKVDKVTGKGLSSNDYTDAAKAKVDALASVATSGSYNDLTNKPTIPTALPNPNALTFAGAVTGSYDGSAPLEVAIPSGGGSSGGGGDVFELIGEATSSGVSDASGLTIPFDGSLYKTIVAYAYNLPAGNNKRIVIRTNKAWYDGFPLGWNTLNDTYQVQMTNMKNTWGFFGAAIDVCGKLFTLGAAEANTNGGHGFFRFYPQNGALPTLSLSGCKFISLDCNSNSEILPDGCSLIVWGVRK